MTSGTFSPELVAWAPGRTEVAGNHLDHQGGQVLTAAISDGVEIQAARKAIGCIEVESEGFGGFAVDLANTEPDVSEFATSASLVRGMAAGFMERGVPVGGCELHVTSTLPAGGGMSSSAAFEMAVGRVLDGLFGSGDMPALELAALGKQAECEYFGKPCGLQDQAASALGGINLIDFSDEAALGVRPVPFDFAKAGYDIVLVDTCCDHSAYTDEFTRVAEDMHEVAELFGERVLGRVPEERVVSELFRVRNALGDRAALRALHFYNEMRLVDARVCALEAGDMDAFLSATRRSGASSAQYLQNVSTYDADDQPAMIVLALADRFLGDDGACRIHGGGFGGTVQAYVPSDMTAAFCDAMERDYARGCCRKIAISETGACARCR